MNRDTKNSLNQLSVGMATTAISAPASGNTNVTASNIVGTNDVNYVDLFNGKGAVYKDTSSSNLKNALKADGFDMMPLFVGVVSSGVLAKQGFVIEFSGGIFSGFVTNYYVDKKKDELKKSEQENLSNLSNNSKAKSGGM